MGVWVRVVAWCYGIVAGVVLVVGYPLAMLLVIADQRRSVPRDDVGPLFLLLALLLLVPAVLGAIGTLRGRRWGPIALGYVAALLLLVFPWGTLVGALSLVALAPTIRADWVRQRNANAGRSSPWGTPTGSCVHLLPIETAMRRKGVPLQVAPSGRVVAACTIDLLALGRHFSPLGPVRLSEPGMGGEREPPDDTRALLWCDACRCGIQVVAPSRAPPGTLIFPEPAAM